MRSRWLAWLSVGCRDTACGGDGRRQLLHAPAHREGDGQCHGLAGPRRAGRDRHPARDDGRDAAHGQSRVGDAVRRGSTSRPARAGRGRATARTSWHVKVAHGTAGRWMLGLGISISEADHVQRGIADPDQMMQPLREPAIDLMRAIMRPRQRKNDRNSARLAAFSHSRPCVLASQSGFTATHLVPTDSPE